MRASVPHSDRTSDIDPSQPAAEAAIEKLLASWHSDDSRGLESAYLWEDAAMDAIDALSALLGAVDLAETAGTPEPAVTAGAEETTVSAPRLISQRSRT
jgi:hypothetical protein